MDAALLFIIGDYMIFITQYFFAITNNRKYKKHRLYEVMNSSKQCK